MRSERILIICGVVVLLGLGVIGLLSYIKITRSVSRIAASQASLSRLQSGLSGPGVLDAANLQSMVADLNSVESNLVWARKELSPLLPLAGALGWVPGVGSQLRAAPALLDAGIDVTGASRLAGEVLQPVIGAMGNKGSVRLLGDDGFDERLIATLASGKGKLQEAQGKLQRASERLRQVDRSGLPSNLSNSFEKLDKVAASVQTAIDLGTLGPDLANSLLGMDRPRKYLVVSENSEELRATGGFIGGVWLVGVDKGKIVEVDFKDSAEVDDLSKRYPPPPPAISKYLWGGVWLFRDANWSPDFPTSARNLEDFYKLGQGVQVDGVIALDQQALGAVLGAIGPIVVRDFQDVVDKNNLMDKMIHAPAPPGPAPDDLSPKKRFMEDLFREMIGKFESGLDANTLAGLMEAVPRQAEEKHLLAYFNDETVQKALREGQRDGAVRDSKGDFLMVVDSNVAYRKINGRVDQSISYEVSLEKDAAKGKVTIAYKNNSKEKLTECVQDTMRGATYEQWQEGCYWDYARVYAPKGATIVQASSIPMPKGSFFMRAGNAQDNDGMVAVPEAGKEVFDTFFDVAPGANREIFFSYQLPNAIETNGRAKRYELLVQKQAGTDRIPLKVSVNLPPGAKLVAADPAPAKVVDSQLVFQSNLVHDQRFVVSFLSD